MLRWTKLETKERLALVLWGLAFLALLYTTAKLAMHHMPTDDALRHVGKAATEKPWGEIVVFRPEINPDADAHRGWHTTLSGLAELGMDRRQLITFCIAFPLFAWLLCGAWASRNASAWFAGWTLIAILDQQVLGLLLQGRPHSFLLVFACYMCLRWRDFAESFRLCPTLLATLAAAIVCYWHSSWYLLWIPCAVLLIGGEWKPGLRWTMCVALGSVLGGLATAKPIRYLYDTAQHVWLSVNLDWSGSAGKTGTEELFPVLPTAGPLLLLLAGMMFVRATGNFSVYWREAKLALLMVFVCCTLGMIVGRFWYDLGNAALVVAVVQLVPHLIADTPKWRMQLLGASALLLLATHAHANFTWQRPGDWKLTMAAEALPDKGGVVYSDSMDVFYQLFYRHPNASWRYALGYEAALMPAEVFREYKMLPHPDGYVALLGRLGPRDRLITNDLDAPIERPGYEWKQLGFDNAHRPILSARKTPDSIK